MTDPLLPENTEFRPQEAASTHSGLPEFVPAESAVPESARLESGVREVLPQDLMRHLEALGGQLVWRIGKDEVSDEVIVRLGYASATPRFAFLSRLRSANDADLQLALAEKRVVIEWVD